MNRKKKSSQKPRNYILAAMVNNDINRFHDRCVEGEVRKSKHNRAKAKRDWRREAGL